VDDPATLGIPLAAVTLSRRWPSSSGKLINATLKRIYLLIVRQVPLFLLAAYANGWALCGRRALHAVRLGAIPFIDAMIVVYVDDRMPRVSGMRLAVSPGERARCLRAGPGGEGCRVHGAAHDDGGHLR
jgi:hypothetical protein